MLEPDFWREVLAAAAGHLLATIAFLIITSITTILIGSKTVREKLLRLWRAVKERLPFLPQKEPAVKHYDSIDPVHREEFDKVEAASHDPRKSVIVVYGIGGTGKTTLAHTFLEHLAKKPDYRVITEPFVCKRGLMLESVIANLALAFGEPFRSILEDTTQTTRKKVPSLVTVLKNTGPYGLCFDDYNEANNDDLREFVWSVARHKESNILLLLISRIGWEKLGLSKYKKGVEPVPLEGLPKDAAKELLCDSNPDLCYETDEVIEEIWKKCHGGIPYALDHFAELARDRRKPVAKLLTTLPDFNQWEEAWQRELFRQLTRAEQKPCFSVLSATQATATRSVGSLTFALPPPKL